MILSSGRVRLFLLLFMAALCATSVFARDNGVITLTLEDPQSAPGTEPQPDQHDPIAPTPLPTPLLKPLPPPDVKGASAVLMDADTGQIIWSKNPHTRRPNASTTKIMTAILIIEHCELTDKIKVGKKVCDTPFTSIHLKPGERITVKDLLTGMMIRSANDAAVAAAEHIAGSTTKFARMMNKKAEDIGCADTHFVTPNGLHNKKHYSSAYDLCLMARYAFRYPIFNEIIATRKYTLDSRTINRGDLVVFSKSKFLKYYPGADGVKSGYVKQAGYCYVGSATRGGWRLVSTVLKSDNAGRDTAALMDYGFNDFERVTVARASDNCGEVEVIGGNCAGVTAVPAKDLKVVVPKSGALVSTKIDVKPMEAPITKGAKIGTISGVVNGTAVAKIDLCAADDVGVGFARRLAPWLKAGFFGVCLLMGGRYGAAFTKNSRRRRHRVTASLRGYNRYR